MNFKEIEEMLKSRKAKVMKIINDEEKKWTDQKNMAPENRMKVCEKIMDTVTNFEINLVKYLKCSLLQEHGAVLADEAARIKYYRERCHNMVKTQKKSKLFSPFFYPENPDPYKDEVELYRRYGFYWPTE